MQGLIRDKALGLIETVGLVGAIEACDAAAKAADVIVSAAEVIDPALVTIKIFGELGAVQSAVEAGSAAAARVGQLHSAHIIPNPDDNLDIIMGGAFKPASSPPPRTSSKPKFTGKSGTRPRDVDTPPRERNQDIDMAEMENMRVTELRNFARRIPNLAIKGRQISLANKDQLLAEIRKARGAE
jgi:ethanolamine utilization protein EutM